MVGDPPLSPPCRTPPSRIFVVSPTRPSAPCGRPRRSQRVSQWALTAAHAPLTPSRSHRVLSLSARHVHTLARPLLIPGGLEYAPSHGAACCPDRFIATPTLDRTPRPRASSRCTTNEYREPRVPAPIHPSRARAWSPRELRQDVQNQELQPQWLQDCRR